MQVTGQPVPLAKAEAVDEDEEEEREFEQQLSQWKKTEVRQTNFKSLSYHPYPFAGWRASKTQVQCQNLRRIDGTDRITKELVCIRLFVCFRSRNDGPHSHQSHAPILP